jgi:hypothetical protein
LNKFTGLSEAIQFSTNIPHKNGPYTLCSLRYDEYYAGSGGGGGGADDGGDRGGGSSNNKTKKKLNSVACSPQANYTDRAAAAC